MTGETDGAQVAPDAIVPDADGTLLAIRRLGAELVADPGFQRRFPAEVNALNGLDEPWLAAPTSFLLDTAGRVVASLRRHVPGPRLAEFLEHHPRGLDAQTTTLIALDVLTALSALHARGVVHRAVSAANIVVDADGVCVLVDVGLTPRTGPDALDATIATDLAWFADLVALCLAGRPLGRRRRQAPLLMGAWLPKTVPEPVRSLLRRALDPARGAASAAVAAAMLTELSVSAVQQFDADWDVRARERLRSASWAAAASDPVPAPVREPVSHRRKLTQHRLVRRTHRVSVAFAIMGVGAAVGVCAALTGSTGSAPRITQIMMYETPSSGPPSTPGLPATSTASATASANPARSAPAPTPSPSVAPTTPPVSPQPSSPSTSRAPEVTTVTRLTIVKFAYADGVPAEAVVVVRVHVSTTRRITLNLTFAGSNESGVAGTSSPTTVSYTLEGKRSYLVAYRIYGFAYCYTDFWGVTVSTSPHAPTTQYAQLPSILCWGPDIKPSDGD